jgi:DnaD/phage-associated family protein
MPLFIANKNTEYISVPGSFIKTYMVESPGEYVKVYLMGLLYLSENRQEDIHGFCKSLGLSCDEVIRAFEYWQQKGLIRIQNGQSLSFQYNFKAAPASSDLYTEQAYNVALQKLFGSRILTPADYNKIYDYTDIFRLPKEVVLVLVEYCVKAKGKSISFSYIDAIAKAWTEEGVSSAKEAETKLERYEAGISNAGKVLEHLGIMNRLPTKDEISLYNKWTKDWGFSLDAVKMACMNTTKSRNPSMKYLDTILKDLYEKNRLTSSSIYSDIEENEVQSEKIKKLLSELGLSTLTVTPEHIAFFRKWSTVFPYDMILYAARQSAKYAKKSIAYVEKVLASWDAAGYRSVAEVESRIKANALLNKKLESVFKLAGIQKSATEADRKKYIKWTKEWDFAQEVLELACEISSVSDNPYRYLEKLLSIWYEKGIKTLAQATQEVKKTPVKAPEKKNNAESLKYMQRNYSEDELSSLFGNAGKRSEG